MLPDKDTLGTEFAIIIREWLTPSECAEIDRLNATENDPTTCHSHDFCDPNQAMIDAFGRFNVELDVQNPAHVDLVNAAWESAKRSGFGYAKE